MGSVSAYADKILLGDVPHSGKEITNHSGVIDAGLVVRLKSDDTITTAKSDGAILGVSVGRDLSNTARTAICRKGLRVPVLLASGFTTPVIGAQVAINDTTGEARAYTGTGDSYVNAVYSSGLVSAIKEDIAMNGIIVLHDCAFIDFPGGL